MHEIGLDFMIMILLSWYGWGRRWS